MEDIFAKFNKSFFYEETDFAAIKSDPYRFKCGIDIICVEGKGVLSTGIETYSLQENDELIFLGGTILQCMEASENFKVRLFTFSHELFNEATLKLDTSYFHFLDEVPLYHHPIGCESWTNVNLWMDMAYTLYRDVNNQFRVSLLCNFLQSYLMWIFNTIPTKYIFTGDNYSRRQILFRRFIALIHKESTLHRDVAYYANKLCISTRYLSEVAAEYGKNPKSLIDEQLIAEIKVLLRYSDLSITEIAIKFKFPDQSYMSRFFKRNTRIAPRNYRLKVL